MAILRGILAAALALQSFCAADTTLDSPKSMITPAPRPRIEIREPWDYVDFIGYYTSPGVSTYLTSTCPGPRYAERYVSSYWYAGCQAGSVLSVFTSCYGSTAYGYSIYTSSSYSSTSYTSTSCFYSCVTDMMNSGGTYSSYFIQCESRSPVTFIRQQTSDLDPLTFTPTTSSTPISTSPGTPTTAVEPVTVTSTQTSLPTVDPGENKKKKSVAGPIAGGVIGGLAVIAFAILGVWICLKKRRQRNASAHGQGLPVMLPQPGYVMPPVAMPEKAVMSPTHTSSPHSPPQQPWGPGTGYPPSSNPSMMSYPSGVPAGYPTAPPSTGYNGLSPPSSPPPPHYLPNQQPAMHIPPQQQPQQGQYP